MCQSAHLSGRDDLKIDHIGYLVKDVRKSAAEFEKLGYAPKGDICRDEARRAEIAFLENGGYVIELVAPLDDSSVAWSLLKKNGAGPYHICYEVENLEITDTDLVASGFARLVPEQVAPALGDRRVAFYMGRGMGMLEIVEAER
jgi:methylmalonyl-CoA/ethylmalonyl-CoA epimerase